MTKIIKKSPQIIRDVIDYLKAGEIVILHTDVVYIFLANGLIPQSVNKIHELKNGNLASPLSY